MASEKPPGSTFEGPEGPLTRTSMARALGVTPRRMNTWLESDPAFPRPALVDRRGRPAWSGPAVRDYRRSLVTEAEFAEMAGVSVSTLYVRSRSDPAFPSTVMPRTGRFAPLWRREQAAAYAAGHTGPPRMARPANPAVVTFAEFAGLLGIGVPGLHRHKKNDPCFPKPVTTGRGALYARADAELYKAYRAGGPAPRWQKHTGKALDLVTVSEFAAIAGLDPETVTAYLAQGKRGFPAAAADSRYPVWTRAAAEDYARLRAERSRPARPAGRAPAPSKT